MSPDDAATLPADMLSMTGPLKEMQADVQGVKKAEDLGEKGIAEENKVLGEKAKLVGEQRQETKAFDASHPFPQPDIKPWTAKPPENNPIQRFGSWASAFGVLAGAITKTGLASSLNASAAAMNAMRKNDLDAYDEAKTAWKENTDIAIKQAEWEAKSYQHGWDLMEKDQAAGLSQLEIAAEQAHNTQLLATLRAGKYKEAFEMTKGIATFAQEGPKRAWELEKIAGMNRSLMQKRQDWLKQHPDQKQIPPVVDQGLRTEVEQAGMTYRSAPPGATYFEKKTSAIDDAIPLVEAMNALINYDPNTIGVIGRRNTILGNILGQLGSDVTDAQARAEQVKQLANMAIGPLNEVYGSSGRFNKSMLDIINNIDPVTGVLISPQNAIQSLNTLYNPDTKEGDLVEKRGRYQAATRRSPAPSENKGTAEPQQKSDAGDTSEPLPSFNSLDEAQAAAEIEGWDVGTMFQIEGEDTPRRVTKKVAK